MDSIPLPLAEVPMASSGPRLVLVRQTPEATSLEQCSARPPAKRKRRRKRKIDTSRPMHVVVKNTPFTMDVALVQGEDAVPRLDVNNLTFEATLLYDNEDPTSEEEKPVDYLSVQPLELRRETSDDGAGRSSDFVSFQVRIKVLSSHHDNLLFRVKIQVIDPIGGRQLAAGLRVISNRIRVLSKPDTKKQSTRQTTSTTGPPAKVQKCSKEQRLRQAMQAVEAQQQEQASMLQAMLQHVATFGAGMPGKGPEQSSMAEQPLQGMGSGTGAWETPLALPFPSYEPATQADATSGAPQLDEGPGLFSDMLGSSTFGFDFDFDPSIVMFDNAFETFLMLYNTLPAHERPRTIRRMMRASSAKATQRLTAFLHLLSTEGLQATRARASDCACACCPYQHQLEQMEKDTFSLGDGAAAPNMGLDDEAEAHASLFRMRT